MVFTSLLGIVIWGDLLAPAGWLAVALIIASGVLAIRNVVLLGET